MTRLFNLRSANVCEALRIERTIVTGEKSQTGEDIRRSTFTLTRPLQLL